MLAKKGLMTAPAAVPLYVENVFSTTTYAGAGGTKTVTNNIDLSGEGGMVWIKAYDYASIDHGVWDTVRGAGTSNSDSNAIKTNTTTAESNTTQDYISSFHNDGFAVTYGAGTTANYLANRNGANYASWTFRKAEKFFDVVTYTGDGASSKTISHNLGSTPGCIIVKCTSNTYGWRVYHRGTTSPAEGNILQLNTTDAEIANGIWGNTAPTSTNFTVGNGSSFPAVNANGETYVAYLFAHDAGGFGNAGSDNIITCGSYTGNGSSTGPTVTIGYEPQWLLVKRADAAGSWRIYDSVRDNSNPRTYVLYPDLADQEEPAAPGIDFNSTSFQPKSTSNDINGSGATYIYIAIRKNMN